MANWASINDLICLKSAFKNVISNYVLTVEEKPVKFKITKNTTHFKINSLYDVCSTLGGGQYCGVFSTMGDIMINVIICLLLTYDFATYKTDSLTSQ